jgi:hypothetical protein
MNIYPGYSLSNPEFIEANRRGEVAGGQRAALGRATGWLGGYGGLITTLILLPALLVVVLIVVAVMDTRHEAPLYIYGVIVAAFGIIILVAAVPQALSARRAAMLRRGLAAGRVEPVEGEVRWDGRKYRADASGRRLNSPMGELGVAPGRYRFYVLADSDILLSAEAIPGAEASEGGLSLVSALARVHKFQLDALEANRQGRLAGSQSSRLLLRLALRLVAIPVVIGVAAAGAVYVMRSTASDQGFALWVLGVFAVGLTLYAIWQSMWLGFDLASGKVAVAEGPVQRIASVSGSSEDRSVSYYYTVGDKRFSVSSRAYSVLIPGLTYRVYYAPRSKRLVAIEPV